MCVGLSENSVPQNLIVIWGYTDTSIFRFASILLCFSAFLLLCFCFFVPLHLLPLCCFSASLLLCFRLCILLLLRITSQVSLGQVFTLCPLLILIRGGYDVFRHAKGTSRDMGLSKTRGSPKMAIFMGTKTDTRWSTLIHHEILVGFPLIFRYQTDMCHDQRWCVYIYI